MSGPPCQLPAPLSHRARWRSLDSSLSLHLDSGNTSFSFLKSGTLLEQVSLAVIIIHLLVTLHVSTSGELPLCHNYHGGKNTNGRTCQVRMVSFGYS